MGNIRLFQTDRRAVTELRGEAVARERSLQEIVEHNMPAMLGVRFLASEFITSNGGRMDTLGIDRDGSPVIVEYKRSTNENIITQGLFYLDWLMDHRGDFEWLVLERWGPELARAVDWRSPRLICIARDFVKFDVQAVNQMNRNIELLRYDRFEDDLLLLEQLSPAAGRARREAPGPGGAGMTQRPAPPRRLDPGAGHAARAAAAHADLAGGGRGVGGRQADRLSMSRRS